MTTMSMIELVEKFAPEFTTATFPTASGNKFLCTMERYELMAVVISLSTTIRTLAEDFERMEGELLGHKAIDREKWVTSR